MLEIGIRGGIVTQCINMQKLIINTLKIMIRIKNCNFLNNGTKKIIWLGNVAKDAIKWF